MRCAISKHTDSMKCFSNRTNAVALFSLAIVHLKKRVGKNYIVHSLHFGVCLKLRIDVEEYWHVYLLPRKKCLLLKAKALYLIKVNGSLHRSNIVCGYTSNWSRTAIFSSIKCQSTFTRFNPDLSLCRNELPWHSISNISIKLDNDLP